MIHLYYRYVFSTRDRETLTFSHLLPYLTQVITASHPNHLTTLLARAFEHDNKPKHFHTMGPNVESPMNVERFPSYDGLPNDEEAAMEGEANAKEEGTSETATKQKESNSLPVCCQ
jgi:hypothetical protein